MHDNRFAFLFFIYIFSAILMSTNNKKKQLKQMFVRETLYLQYICFERNNIDFAFFFYSFTANFFCGGEYRLGPLMKRCVVFSLDLIFQSKNLSLVWVFAFADCTRSPLYKTQLSTRSTKISFNHYWWKFWARTHTMSI